MSKKPTLAAVSSKTGMEQQARSLLDAGKFKEAIALYKKLLQGSDNSAWRKQLAYCYLQRAKAFATKGMFKEARGLWENHREHTQPPYEAYDHYIVWSLQTKNPDTIRSSLQSLTAQQLDKDYPELAAILGLLILTEYPEFQQALPQDSAFIAHLKIVQTALQAFRNDEPEHMDEALKQLPYRSAFRDLRTLLKAGKTVSKSVDETRSLLGKIPANSPYTQTAQLMRACTMKGSALVHQMLTFNPLQRRLIGEFTGLNKQQLALVESLAKQKQPWSDKIKFNLAVQFQALFGAEPAQRFCSSTLATYPAGRRDYGKAFGALDEFETNRLQALACERDGKAYDAGYFWKQCVNASIKNGDRNGLKIALILRHIADSLPAPEQIPLLIESLEHDPDDKDCMLKVLNHYRQDPDSSDKYKQWLDKALAQFPQDLDILTLATQAATRNKAFKKAIHYASNMLRSDPLNSFAKQVIFSSHLAHARRLLKTKKYHLVEPEIEQAQALKLGKSYNQQTQLLKSLLRFAADDKQQGLLAIGEVLNQLNPDPVAAHFQAAVEAQLTGLPVATLLRELPPAKDRLISAQGLARLVQLIAQYGQEQDNRSLIHKALDKIKAPLKQSVLQQNFDEDLLLNLCQILDSIQHFELLRHCAKRAHSKWRKPLWLYYRIYSETNGNPEKASYQQRLSLQFNLDSARQDNDQRASVLIQKYLDRYFQMHPQSGLDFFDDLFGQDAHGESRDPIYELFGHLPDKIYDKIDKKADALVQKTSPERLLQELSQIIGNNRNVFLAMMKDPDLFTALMLVKAAGELNMDIGVGFRDVLEYFEVDQNQRSIPF